MTKIITSILLFAATLAVNAQVEPVGTNEYPRLENIMHDNVVENKLFATTLGNHIVSSDDNGETWNIFYSFPANVLLKDIKHIDEEHISFNVFLHHDFNKVSIYILNKETKEITKQITPLTPADANSKWIKNYDIHEDDNDYVLVNIGYKIGIDSYSMVYLTKDGGENWVEVYDQTSYNNITTHEVRFSPDNKEKMFISLGFGPTDADGGLLVSSDGGENWEDKFPNLEYGTIGFDPSNSDIFYVGNTSGLGGSQPEMIFKTTDGGETFVESEFNWTDVTFNSILGIYINPNDSNNIVALEDNEIVISKDGGATWTNHAFEVFDLDNTYHYGTHFSFNPFNTDEIIITSDFRAFKSTNGGETLGTKVLAPFYTAHVAGSFYGEEEHVYYTVQSGIGHKNLTTETENIYNVQPVDVVTVNEAAVFVDKNHEGQIFSVVSGFLGSSFNVSTDHGATSTPIFSPGLSQIYDLNTDPNNANIVWMSLSSNEFIKLDFTEIFNPTPTFITTPNAEKFISAFEIDKTDSNHIIIGLVDEIYESTDAGENWTLINSGIEEGEVITDIVQNPDVENEYLATAKTGIYKTTDLQNWEKVFTAENVRHAAYSTEVEGQVVAAIHSGEFVEAQLLYSKDNADTWNALPFEKIDHIASSSIDFSFKDEFVIAYIATGDLGIVKYMIDLADPLDIPNFDQEKTFNVYPNPSSSNVTVSIKNQEVKSISLYSITGKRLNTIENSNTLNLSSYKEGIYFIKVLTTQNEVYLRKIVKE
ncbi:T9SS type A sorting domain-containing protein [Aureivirga sp. CE67]|uniref:T9SS type A sorting domain-containing protein n=1 Tax=Aureivirga sp. CE67 TaxID=1788983 RepID=UPI0018CBE4CF|nr:T9SS type A sorting domain-containing protein [Aureivirga sp. CE67]